MSALSKAALKAAFESLPTPITRAALETLFDNTIDSYQDTLPQLTTAQINDLTPTLNQLVYNTDTNFVMQYNGSVWVSLVPMLIGDTATINASTPKAGQLFYNTTLQALLFGNGATLKNLYDNIYNTDGTLTANRTLTLDDKYLALGNSASNEPTLSIGDLTPFGGDPDSIVGVAGYYGLQSYISRGDGFFFEMRNDDENAEAVFVMTQQSGNLNIGAITVYDEDGSVQRGRIAASYDKSTGVGYGMICMVSDYDNTSNNYRNYFAAYNNFIKGRYYHSYTGELMAITIDDSGLQVDVDGVASFNIDYNGVISSETLAALDFANDAAAAAGGVMVNGLYHHNGAVRIRLT